MSDVDEGSQGALVGETNEATDTDQGCINESFQKEEEESEGDLCDNKESCEDEDDETSRFDTVAGAICDDRAGFVKQ